jgi:hypothetical protein
MDAMADARDAAEPFQIDIQQVTDVGPLVPLHRRRRSSQRDAIQPGPSQYARRRRPRQPQGGADLLVPWIGDS